MEVIRIPTAPYLEPEDLRAWDRARSCLVGTLHSEYGRDGRNGKSDSATGSSMLDTHTDDAVRFSLHASADASSFRKINIDKHHRIPKEGMGLSQVRDGHSMRFCLSIPVLDFGL